VLLLLCQLLAVLLLVLLLGRVGLSPPGTPV
jgi:hypothetical protein